MGATATSAADQPRIGTSRRSVVAVVLAYLVFSTVWIVASDWAPS